MKTKYNLLALACAISIPYAVNGQKSVYTLPFDNTFRLYGYSYSINMEEISSTYQTLNNIYTTEITGFGDDTMEQTSYTYISDARVVDVVRFLEIYMEDQLLDPGKDPLGTAEMSVIYYNSRSTFNGGSILVILTFGIGSLFGIPWSNQVVDLELEARFTDPSGDMISRHRGVGRGRTAQTIYSHNNRKAHQKAIRKALTDLNRNISSDIYLMHEALPVAAER
jgi:hypothetical protein